MRIRTGNVIARNEVFLIIPTNCGGAISVFVLRLPRPQSRDSQ